MPEPLTLRQREVVTAIESYHKKTSQYPSLMTLSRDLGVDYTTVRDHIRAIHEKGWLRASTPGPILHPPKKEPLPIPPRDPEDEADGNKRDATDLLKDVKIEKHSLPGQTQTSSVIIRNKNKTWKLRVVRTQGQITGLVFDDTI